MTDWDERWRRVRTDKSGAGATAVRIERLSTGGFLFHTREPGGEFDVWLETEEGVFASLAEYELVDDDGGTPGTLPTTSTKS